MTPRRLELLAPARDVAVAFAALEHGADAVYMGAPSHGARAAAANSIDDLRRVADRAHAFGARLYVTVNTLVYDHELADVERLIYEIYRAGADALIVQDMGLLRLDLPPIDLHASTQCDIRTPEKARFLSDVGFSQLVIPRETTIREIEKYSQTLRGDARIEAFVHGALCVSYSGDCQASQLLTGRSANRGQCSQICRLPYDLIDGHGNVVEKGKHLLSLRDLNRLEAVDAMVEAGVDSFKIEGRLKDENYVKAVVSAYNNRINRIVDASGGNLVRASQGRVDYQADVNRVFNRGFTPYFLTARPKGCMAQTATPKALGMKVAEVKNKLRSKQFRIKALEDISNGDGLGFIDRNGLFSGFRVNRITGDTIHTFTDIDIPPGATLYRSYDKAYDDRLSGSRVKRRMDVSVVLRLDAVRRPVIDLFMDERLAVSVAGEEPVQNARSPRGADVYTRILGKAGETDFNVVDIRDLADLDIFIPASSLTALRRRAFERLSMVKNLRHRYLTRRSENLQARFPQPAVDRHANVANRLAQKFYEEHGAKVLEQAVEVQTPREKEPVRVMTTRYCLRRELGACLQTPQGRKLAEPLTLRAAGFEMGLKFDCANCRMECMLKS